MAQNLGFYEMSPPISLMHSQSENHCFKAIPRPSDMEASLRLNQYHLHLDSLEKLEFYEKQCITAFLY